MILAFVRAVAARIRDAAAAVVADAEHEIEEMQFAAQASIAGAGILALVLVAFLIAMM